MESPLQSLPRLLGALESLSDQESAAIRAEAWTALGPIQDRTAELLTGILAMVAELGGPSRLPAALRSRLQAFHRQCDLRSQDLLVRMAANRRELSELGNAQNKLQQFGPAYLNPGRRVASPGFAAHG